MTLSRLKHAPMFLAEAVGAYMFSRIASGAWEIPQDVAFYKVVALSAGFGALFHLSNLLGPCQPCEPSTESEDG